MFTVDVWLDQQDTGDPVAPFWARVRLSGQLDIAWLGCLRALLDQLRDSGYRYAVLDILGLETLSVAGAKLLARACEDYAGAGGALTLIRPTPMVQRGSAPAGHQELVPHSATGGIPHQRRPAGSDSTPLSLA